MEAMLRKVTSQVLFVDCQPRRAVVDGTLLEDGGPGAPVGTPVTFILKLPPSETVSAVVAETFARWAEAGRLVEIELHSWGTAHRATLSDGTSTLRLELEAAA